MQPFLRWKGKSSTYFKCMSVALGIQHVMPMRHLVICGLSDSTVFFYVTQQTARSRGGGDIQDKTCGRFFSTTFSKAFFVLRIKQVMIRNVYWTTFKYRYSCPNLMNLELSLQIFEKCSNVIFHENPYSWS
jgi:hypothetical protein